MTPQDLIARAERLGVRGQRLERLFFDVVGRPGFTSRDDEERFAAALDAIETRRGRWTRKAVA